MSLPCSKFFTVSHWAEDKVEGRFCKFIPLASAAIPSLTQQGPSFGPPHRFSDGPRAFLSWGLQFCFQDVCLSLLDNSHISFGSRKCHFLTENFSELRILTEVLSVISCCATYHGRTFSLLICCVVSLLNQMRALSWRGSCLPLWWWKHKHRSRSKSQDVPKLLAFKRWNPELWAGLRFSTI